MKHSLVVVFAVVLVGLWYLPCNDAVPIGDLTTGLDSLVGGLDNNVKDIISSLESTTSGLLSDVMVELDKVKNTLTTVLESGLEILPSVVHWIISTVRTLVSRIGMLVGFNGSISFPSFLSSTFEGALSDPINAVRGWLSTIESKVLQVLGNHSAEFIRSLENFITSTALPWLHSTLDQIESSYNVPVVVRGMIDSFNTIYKALELFGFVKA